MPQETSRRSLLRASVAVTALGSVAASFPMRAHGVETDARANAASRSGIDAVLRRAVDAKEVPGVVAMAASDKGVFYDAAFDESVAFEEVL